MSFMSHSHATSCTTICTHIILKREINSSLCISPNHISLSCWRLAAAHHAHPAGPGGGRPGGRRRPRPPSPWPDRSKGAKMAGRIGVHLGNRCEVLRPHSFRDRQCPSAFSPLHISSSFAIILLEGLQKTIPLPTRRNPIALVFSNPRDPLLGYQRDLSL